MSERRVAPEKGPVDLFQQSADGRSPSVTTPKRLRELIKYDTTFESGDYVSACLGRAALNA